MTDQDVRQMRQVALVLALAAKLNATVAGMVAENNQREHQGESMAYQQDSFQIEIERSGINGWNTIIELLNS